MGRVAVGVDVAARRGCDVVVMGNDLVARPAGRVWTADDLRRLLEPLRPGVVAIDAPRAWSTGPPRSCERALRAAGISVFTTPDAARAAASSFYDWMHTGFAMFAGASEHPTLETFPHAVAVVLHGEHPDRGLLRRPAAKRAWRLAALDAAGVDHSALRTIDEIDAALCAFTGLRWLAGDALVIGDHAEGAITLPASLGRVTARGTR